MTSVRRASLLPSSSSSFRNGRGRIYVEAQAAPRAEMRPERAVFDRVLASGEATLLLIEVSKMTPGCFVGGAQVVSNIRCQRQSERKKHHQSL